MLGILNKLIGDSNDRALKQLQPLVGEINALEDEFRQMSLEQLRGLTVELKKRYQDGEQLDDLLPEAFAAVREVSRRKLGMRHFDVQLMGGVVLHEGKIAELGTGEGKTLVATLPAYLNALTGNSVHVVTVNDYLVKRDASWMGEIYHSLGITVGCLQNNSSFVYDPESAAAQRRDSDESGEGVDASTSFAAVAGENLVPATKQQAYACDVVYGTNNEFGFDYLRDNMVDALERKVQRNRAYAIVDEVDNILIDEARTPLIISGPARDKGQEYRRFAQMSTRLARDDDFEVDEKRKAISLTDEGINKVERLLAIDNLYSPENDVLSHFVENAIRAEFLYQRDREYVVRDTEIVIVDEFTGRLMEGRRFSDGLHQALEAKENVQVKRESVTYATITLQNYFRMYEKLSGMTGTAVTEAEEFFKIYKLEVVQVPTNKPTGRRDLGDQIFMTEAAKWNAVATKVQELHEEGVPVLIGTTSIDKSEVLAGVLKKRGIQCNVLNAKNHQGEAEVIAQAGRSGAITVSTNMAGRGTDIILGGNPDMLGQTREEWQGEHERVVELGGLFVLGTERHESRRIDNQLRGRAGRQGDPGKTQFLISTEDDLVRRFGGERIRGTMRMFRWNEDEAIENRMISRSIETAQTKVEAYHFEIRKHLVDYDDVVNTHRDVIYKLRDKVLAGSGLRETILGYVENEVGEIVAARLAGAPESWDITGFRRDLMGMFPAPQTMQSDDDLMDMQPDEVARTLVEHAVGLYDQREQEFTPDVMRKLERTIMLRSIDLQWVEHLTTMDNMRQGIGLEAIGQRDPLVQYKRQAFTMFSELIERTESDISRTIFRVALAQTPPPQARPVVTAVKPDPATAAAAPASAAAMRAAQAVAGQKSVMSAVNSGHGSDVSPQGRKIGRNEPCPCGSGKKYKRCHGAA